MKQGHSAYLFEFHPKEAPPAHREEQKARDRRRVLWGIAAAVGAIGMWLLKTQLHGYWSGIARSIAILVSVVALILLAWGALAGPWDWYQRQASFIALTRQKDLVMRSVVGGVLWSYRVPLAKVKGIRRVVRTSKERGWYFIDRDGAALARFNPDLWPARQHRLILEAIADHAPSIEIVIER